MESNTALKMQITVSDLFRGPYDHAKRLQEQTTLCQRLEQYPEDKILVDIANVLKDMTNSKIASITHQEAVIEKLQRYAKTGKIEVI